MDTSHEHSENDVVQLPAPTAWPFILAFGLTLSAAGLVTNMGIGMLGGLLTLYGCVGWFRQVLPHEHHETIPVKVIDVPITTMRPKVTHIEISESHRARLPLEVYSVGSGLKGGIAGGIAMIIPALLYGALKYHSIWYAVNLLGGVGIMGEPNPSTAYIAAFHWQAVAAATVIHVVTSLLVGLLYAALLPMMPRRPILMGGLIAPLLWTGLIYSTLNIVNPILDQRIAWVWFFLSQIVFGVVAGLVVARQGRIRTSQHLPFVVRMGLEAPGLIQSHHQEDLPK
ncbi:MAG TPA: hypothetical protein VM554_13520 [Acidisarcina sp.]|nr:hypothetical protein [Acidisarcina sp.]